MQLHSLGFSVRLNVQFIRIVLQSELQCRWLCRQPEKGAVSQTGDVQVRCFHCCLIWMQMEYIFIWMRTASYHRQTL